MLILMFRNVCKLPSAKITNDKDKHDVSEDASLDNVESEVTSFLENCSSASRRFLLTVLIWGIGVKIVK